VVIIVLVLGAIFACINLLYASFLDRIRELGTLMAIGYKRSSIAWLVVQEGLLLALAGGALGVGVGYAANGHTMRMNDGQLTYQIHVTLRVLGAGAAVSALIGLLGSFIAAMQALRIDVLRAIRG
jgi:putative ABC transport system permease protein